MKLNDLTNMASPIVKFVSVSRKVGCYLLNSVFIAHAVADVPKMDSLRSAKVEKDPLRFIKRPCTLCRYVRYGNCQKSIGNSYMLIFAIRTSLEHVFILKPLRNTVSDCSYVALLSQNVDDNVLLYHAQCIIGLFLFLLVCCCGTLTAGVCCPDDMRELCQSGS